MEVLSDLHDRCCRSFEDLLEALTSTTHAQAEPEMLHETIESEYDKYMLWAANVGAMHRGEYYDISLDYRLRESPFYRDRVCS